VTRLSRGTFGFVDDPCPEVLFEVSDKTIALLPLRGIALSLQKACFISDQFHMHGRIRWFFYSSFSAQRQNGNPASPSIVIGLLAADIASGPAHSEYCQSPLAGR
jgi:hypothetical protein